jgi:phage minor structural protein
MIYILDKSEDVVGVLSNDNPDACPYFDDLLKESLEDFRLTYEFKVPSNHDTAELIEEGGYFIRKGLDGELLMFRIKIVEEDHSDINTKYIYGESAGLELLYTTIRPTNQTALSAESAMSFLLAETRWSVGIVEVDGTTNLQYDDYATALQRLLELATAFSGELLFRVEMVNGKLFARYVDLLERRGSDTGKQFTYDKDIKSIKRTVDTTDVVTALIGVGKGDESGNYVTFEDVSWSTEHGDPVDKPLGQDWVGDDEAAAQWGVGGRHLFGVYQCDSENGIDLLNKTWEQLKTQSQPKITYEMDVALLEFLAGYEHERVRLGDTVVVYDKTFSPVVLVNARIQELEISFTNPDNNKATLSNFTQAKSNITAQLLALQSKLHKKEIYWDTAKEVANTAQQIADNAQQSVDEVKDQIVYKVDIISTNGNIFKNGMANTTLIATVYKGKDDITSTLPNTAFIWQKINSDGTHDTAWENAHVGVGRSITITKDDIASRATFQCQIDITE